MKYGAGLGTKLMKGWTLGNRQFPTVTGNIVSSPDPTLSRGETVW